MFTYRERFLLHQEFIVDHNVTTAISIPAIITYEKLTVSQFANIEQISFL